MEKRKHYASQNKATVKFNAENYDNIQARIRKGKKARYQEAAKLLGLSFAAFLEQALDAAAEQAGVSMDGFPERNPLPQIANALKKD